MREQELHHAIRDDGSSYRIFAVNLGIKKQHVILILKTEQ